MYPPELQWLKYNVLEAEIDTIIECGRQDGASALWMSHNLPHVKIYSIDLDDRPEIALSSRNRLESTSVKAITGNIFDVVPEIVRDEQNARIAIIEDAVKGWPGLCLLTSMFFYSNVKLLAQHNVHLGHKTRTFWENLTANKAFLENSNDESISSAMSNWVKGNNVTLSNRSLDHSSLAICRLDHCRNSQIDYLLTNLKRFGNWSPIDYRKAHSGNTFEFYSSFKRNSIVAKLLSKKR